MQEGAFALIDCLGWKGVWKRDNKRNSAINKLRQVEKDAKYSINLVKNLHQRFSIDLKTNFTMLSDTIVISSPYVNTGQVQEVEDYRKGLTIFAVIALTAKFLQLFMLDEPYLALRGCITFGEHSIRKNFIVGPAVDEAAENYEIANGAFVWLHPNTAEEYEKYRNFRNKYVEPTLNLIKKNPANFPQPISLEDISRLTQFEALIPMLIEYDMPIKGGSPLLCSVVNPLTYFQDSGERAKIILNYLESFKSRNIGVLIKRQNTMSLLAEADKQCKVFFDKNLDLAQLGESFGMTVQKDYNS